MGIIKLFPDSIKILRENPSLLNYALLSVVLTLVIFIILGTAGFCFFNNFISEYIEHLNWGTWGNILLWLFNLQFILVYCVIVFFSFTAMGNIICLPLLDIISEKVELIVGEETDIVPFWKSIMPSMKSAFIFLFIKLFIFIILLPLFFVPFIGAFLFFIFGALFLAVDYLDFPMGRRAWSFTQKKQFLQAHKFEYLLFGIIVCFGMMIPFVNFLIFPIATIAGTLFFMECELGKKAV